MLAMSIQTIGYAFEILSVNLDIMVFWLRLEYIGASFYPVLIMYFIREYLDERRIANRYMMTFLLAQNIMTLVLVWTNSLHHLYHSSYSLGQTWGFEVLATGRGIWYYVQVYVLYMVIIFAAYRLHQTYSSATGVYRKKTMLIFCSILIPLVVFLAYLFGFGPDNIDITIFSYVFMGALIAYGLYEHDLLNLLPLTQKDVLDAIDESVIMLDENDNILDYNAAAGRNFNELVKSKQGNLFREIAPFDLVNLEQSESQLHHEGFVFGAKVRNGMKDRFRIIVLQDITKRETAYRELKKLADRDSLTSLYNRRYFLNLFENSMKDGVVAILDIDYFKRINDTYGHLAGDKTLVAFSKNLKGYFKDYPVCRYGGEEFAIFAESLTVDEFRRLLEDCQKKQVGDPDLNGITFSAGISTYRAGYIEVAINTADEKLYKAKEAGRNLVVA
jgi:diguanylate cyclase (GGDEF)-like protein